MKELPTYTPDFEEYIRQGEPDKKERAQIWRTAIGLQQVDGLEVSEYFKENVKRNIEGEISIDEVQKLTKAYYVSKTNREQDDDEKEEADKVAGNISKIFGELFMLIERDKRGIELIPLTGICNTTAIIRRIGC